MIKNTIFCFILFCFSISAFSMEISPRGNAQMNGIAFSTYGEFWLKWKLVATRYRPDIGEMRSIYANDIAWSAMKSGDHKYPKGSVFGKVSWSTERDAYFNDSIGQKTRKAVAYMVKDDDVYHDTQGWGYATFNAIGTIGPAIGDQKKVVKACAGCHLLAKNNGYVFVGSIEHQKDFLAANGVASAGSLHLEEDSGSFAAAIIPIQSAPGEIRNLLPKDIAKIVRVGKNISKNATTDTSNEMYSIMRELHKKYGLPTAFWSEDAGYWGFVKNDESRKTCIKNGAKGKPLMFLSKVSGIKIFNEDGAIIQTRYFCEL